MGQYAYKFDHETLIHKLEEVYEERLEYMDYEELYNSYVAMYESFDFEKGWHKLVHKLLEFDEGDSEQEEITMRAVLKFHWVEKIKKLSYEELLEEWEK